MLAFRSIPSLNKLLFFLLIGCLGLLSQAVQSADLSSEDTEIWVVTLELDKFQLASDFNMIEKDSQLYVPLQRLLRLLEVYQEKLERDVHGWFPSEDQKYDFDFSHKTWQRFGRSQTIESRDFFEFESDIYVSAPLLTESLGFILQFDRKTSDLRILPREKLPLQKRLEREDLRRKFRRSQPYTSVLPRLDLPYENFSFPSLDFSLSPGVASSGQISNYTLQGASDLAQAQLDFFMSGNAQKSNDQSRVTLGRESPDGGLFGQSQLRVVQGGDLVIPEIPLVSNPRLERGVRISTDVSGRNRRFDATVITGQAPPGYEVELYRDGVFVDFQYVPESGIYFFNNVPLSSGANHFYIRIYGPFGASEEIYKNIQIDEALMKKDEVSVDAYVSEPGFQVRDGVSDPSASFASILRAEYGLTDRLTLGGFVARQPLQAYLTSSTNQYLFSLRPQYSSSFDDVLTRASLGQMGQFFESDLKLSALSSYFDVKAVASDLSGSASSVGWTSGYKDLGYSISYANYNNFFSSINFQDYQIIHEQYKFRSSWNTLINSHSSVGTDLNYEDDFSYLGSHNQHLRFGITSRVERTHFLVRYLQDEIRFGQVVGSPTTNADIEVTQNLQRVNVTVGAEPNLQNHAGLSTARLTLGTDSWWRAHFEAGLQKGFNTSIDTYVLTASKQFPQFTSVLQSRYDTSNQWQVLTTFNFSIGKNPVRNEILMTSGSLATTGTILPQVNLETSGTSTEVSDFKVLVNGQNREMDPENHLIRGLSTTEPIDIAVDPASLQDPYWNPTSKGVSVVPRRGKIAQVPLSVHLTGEIEGQIFVNQEPAENLNLVLLDVTEAVIAQATTGNNGEFYFNHLNLGDYKIRVSNTQNEDWAGVVALDSNVSVTEDKPSITELKILALRNRLQ